MNVCNTIAQTHKLRIIIKSALTGEDIYNIIVDINSIINKCFNKFMEDNYYNRLNDTDIKIIYDSSIIYSYYDKTIGNRPIKEINLFENNLEIKEINVLLLFSDSLIYIPNSIRMCFRNRIPRIIYFTKSDKKTSY